MGARSVYGHSAIAATSYSSPSTHRLTISQGVFSGIVGNEHFRDTFGQPSDTLTGIIVSIYNLGAFTGCILNFFIGDSFGRRPKMWFAMGWIIVGAVLQTSAFSVPHILVARFITGIGTGIETSTVPM